MHSDEKHYDAAEPIRGVPARLPEGERILWQGAPAWRTMALRSFHIRKIAIYFAVVLVWDVISSIYDGVLGDVVEPLAQLGVLACVTLGMVALFCWAVQITTVYTITTRRVLIRAGVAVPKTINIPFSRLEAAGLRQFPNGYGNILLTPIASDRIAYLVLWPHVQGWHFRQARPLLRCIKDAQDVAAILGEAIAADGNTVNLAEADRGSADAGLGAVPAAA